MAESSSGVAADPNSTENLSESLSLERPSKRRRVQSSKVSTKFNSSSFLDTHLKDIQTFVISGMKPKDIAEWFHKNFGVDMDTKTISAKIKNWKINGKITVPPISDLNSWVTDTPYPQTECKKSEISKLFFILFFKGETWFEESMQFILQGKKKMITQLKP